MQNVIFPSHGYCRLEKERERGEPKMEMRDKGQEEEEGNENKAEWSEKSQEVTRKEASRGIEDQSGDR